MTRTSRPVLLLVSISLVLFLVGGGLVDRVGAAENSYRQAVLFAEILSLVLDNYVDPVEPDGLLTGAYEGMLAGLDANGAYLTPEEVKEWKSNQKGERVPAGLSVLKAGRTLQVVAVDEGSSADDAGVKVGDQIRVIDGDEAGDYSLEQARRKLNGPAGSRLKIEIVRPSEEFKREEIELVRAARSERPYEVSVEGGTVVLRIHDFSRSKPAALAQELEQAREGGAERLLIDLRNNAESNPRAVAELAYCFTDSARIELRDRAGRLLESLQGECATPLWSEGKLDVLVNGATAGGSEALAMLMHEGKQAKVFGEPSYGLGAEARLYELENGSGLLVSAAQWEIGEGTTWNVEGIEPDEVVRGEGETLEEVQSDQLSRVLEQISAEGEAPDQARKAA